MLAHSVYFWLKPDMDPAEKDAFRQALEALEGVPEVLAIHVGTPASTDRPVIERGYTFGLMTVFEDMAGHDAYQVHPLHKAFLERFSTRWDKVVIYDFE